MPDDKTRAYKTDRNWEIFQRYAAGQSYGQIGKAYDLVPQRVRQIIKRVERSLNLPHGYGYPEEERKNAPNAEGTRHS
jgi:Mor family transcriptional regulator